MLRLYLKEEMGFSCLKRLLAHVKISYLDRVFEDPFFKTSLTAVLAFFAAEAPDSVETPLHAVITHVCNKSFSLVSLRLSLWTNRTSGAVYFVNFFL